MVDLESDLVLAAEIYKANQADTQILVDSVMEAQIHAHAACGTTPIVEVVADKGYHAAAMVEMCEEYSFRSDVPEARREHDRFWADGLQGYHVRFSARECL